MEDVKDLIGRLINHVDGSSISDTYGPMPLF